MRGLNSVKWLTRLKKYYKWWVVALCVISVYVFGLTNIEVAELLTKNQEFLIKNQELENKGKKLDYKTIDVTQLILEHNGRAEFYNLKVLVDKQSAIRDKHYTIIDKFSALTEYKGVDGWQKFEIVLKEFEASLQE